MVRHKCMVRITCTDQNSKTTCCRTMQVAAKVTEAAVDGARVAYAPAGDFAALLFFCISDLVAIDPMYQYSLPWCVAVIMMWPARTHTHQQARCRNSEC